MTVPELLDMVEPQSPPPSDEMIAAFEAKVGGPLPAAYRQFLQRCGGGRLRTALWLNENVGVEDVAGFQASRKDVTRSLPYYVDLYKGRIPTALVPIMSDGFGNKICLGIKGEHSGKIYFWDHELEYDEDDWIDDVSASENIQLVASSFDEFVAGLREDPEAAENEKDHQ